MTRGASFNVQVVSLPLPAVPQVHAVVMRRVQRVFHIKDGVIVS